MGNFSKNYNFIIVDIFQLWIWKNTGLLLAGYVIQPSVENDIFSQLQLFKMSKMLVTFLSFQYYSVC